MNESNTNEGKIVCLGLKSFTADVAREHFKNYEIVPMGTMMGIARLVQEGRPATGIPPYNIGIAPFENLNVGKVLPLLRALRRYTQVKVCKEIAIPIVHCLGMLSGHGDVEVIYSKEEALQQCEIYIDEHYPEAQLSPTLTTGEGAEKIIKKCLKNAAVIASEGNLSGLEIVASDIVPGNVTRFAVLGKCFSDRTGDDKTLLSIHPEMDKVGTLVDALLEFKKRNINLEGVLEVADGKGGYHFYIEATGHRTDDAVRDAIDAVGHATILGCYANSHWRYPSKK